MRVVATAGHVDHGKSSLVHTLTGTDPDRLEEERRRGLTIDLGFAHTTLPSGAGISFVDVPGHVRFIRNMLAGVGAVDACLFVVAATEGWKPQSEEHLRILELVGVGHGIVALTKVDLVDTDLLELAMADLADHVEGSFLAGATVVPVSTVSGHGVTELRTALDELVATTPAAADYGRPRLWVDRVFAAKGSGTVVTGTLTGGSLAVGRQVEVGGRRLAARIRALQTLGREVDEIGPGNRVAVNLAGVDHHDVARGDAVVEPGRWHLATVVDAELQVLASLGHPVSRRGAFTAHLGSGEVPVRLRVLGAEAVRPGERSPVRLHLEPPGLPLLPGDRFVLRESGRSETVGGGEVLDVEPVLRASRARPDRSVDRVIAERGWVDIERLEMLTGVRRTPDLGRWAVDPGALAELTSSLLERIAEAGELGVDTSQLDDRERAALDLMEDVEVVAGRARPAGRPDPLADHPFLTALEAGGTSPPAADNIDRATLRELVRRGWVVERDGVHFHPRTVERAAQVAAELLAAHRDGFTLAQLRDALGTTRKHALPLAAELDARGVTRRRGDLRIAGPRLPELPGGVAP
jgi:selenocysteine-specific elongation factor